MTQQTGRHRRTARLRTDPRLSLQPAGGERISVSMEDAGRATDWYGRGAMGMLGLGYTGAAPAQPVTGLGVNREAIFTKKGIRRNYGRLAIAALCLLLAIALSGQLMAMFEAQSVVSGIRRDIAIRQGDAERLRGDLSAASAKVNVAYDAAQMGMISARGVEVIRIVLPPVIEVDVDQITGSAP